MYRDRLGLGQHKRCSEFHVQQLHSAIHKQLFYSICIVKLPQVNINKTKFHCVTLYLHKNYKLLTLKFAFCYKPSIPLAQYCLHCKTTLVNVDVQERLGSQFYCVVARDWTWDFNTTFCYQLLPSRQPRYVVEASFLWHNMPRWRLHMTDQASG